MPRKSYGPFAVSAACLLASGCESATVPEDRIPPGVETDGTSFRLEALDGWYVVDIPYTFTNRTGGAVYIVNCHETFDMGLERKDPSGWREVWRPVIPLCLSAPIVIRPDSVYMHTLKLFGAVAGNNAFPRIPQARPPWNLPIGANGCVIFLRRSFSLGRAD